MSNLSVVHIISGLGIGGAEQVVMDLSDELVKAGVSVTIVCVTDLTEILRRDFDKRIRIVKIGACRNPLFLARAFIRIVRISNEIKKPLLHAHMFHGLIVAILWRVCHWKARVIFTSHSQLFPAFRRFVVRVTRRLRACDVIFSPNQHIAINAMRVAIIPNGTDFAKLEIQHRKPPLAGPWILICVGRLSAAKAPCQLVAEFAKVSKRDIELWLVGDGQLRRQVEDAIHRFGLTDRVKLWGVRNDVQQLLDKAHVFVLGSNWEGMPIALLEAGARGLPVLATPVGSIPNVLADECGYVAERSDFPSMIANIISNYDAALQAAARFQARVCKEHSLEAMVTSHLDLYDSVCRNS